MTVPALLGQAVVIKEAVAQIDRRTTFICLDVHGQRRAVDENFQTLNGSFDGPPFHHSCRTLCEFLIPGITGTDPAIGEREIKKRFDADPERASKQIARESRAARPDVPPLVKLPFAPPKEVAITRRAEELAKVRHAKAVKAEPSFTQTISQAAEQTKGRMAGLEFNVKESKSLAGKIARDVRDAERAGRRLSHQKALAEINDVNRYTVLFKPSTYGTQQAKFRSIMESRGWTVVKDKNFWRPGPYRGHNSLWEAPDGSKVEIQFHTRQSFKVKMDAHAPFERARMIDPDSQEYKDIVAGMRAEADGVAVPNGALRFGVRADEAAVSDREAASRAARFVDRRQRQRNLDT